jgi:tyrosyl-tRNA synthetase
MLNAKRMIVSRRPFPEYNKQSLLTSRQKPVEFTNFHKRMYKYRAKLKKEKKKLIRYMKKNFVEELRWRGMLQDIMPGTEEQLMKEVTTAYVGIDPTADSLHIGHLCGIMMLRHLQACGHKPIALLGGATGMIGDPSGKSAERNLLTEETLRHNVQCIREQLEHFLDFNSKEENAAELVNNYDWMKDYTFLDFARNIGKLITVNYMMAKDSVKKRFNGEFSQGMSFTEFTYQLLQGYDFVYLNEHKNCKLQMGGSDQWGNITTGTDLIRKISGNEAFALTCPLITKADGGKFGKTESGNIWLSRKYTSPYKFFQFWMNVSDDDAKRYIKIFTSLSREEIEALIAEHDAAPHLRVLQKRLAKEVTCMVHSEEDYNAAVEASNILFGNATADALRALDEATFLDVFNGVETYEIPMEELKAGIGPLDLLAEKTNIFPSKGEARKMIQANGFSLNKEKLTDPATPLTDAQLLNGKYLLFQKGKKNYYLVVAR